MGRSPFPDKYIQANKYIRQDLFEYTIKKNGDTDSTLKESVNYNYYDNGLISDATYYDQQGFLYQKLVYSYEQHGYISKIESFSYFHQPSIRQDFQSTSEFVYDTLGREVLKVQGVSKVKNPLAQAINKSAHASEKKEYDSQGRWIKLFTKYKDDMDWVLQYSVRYDNEGNPEAFNLYEAADKTKPVVSYAFNTETEGNIKTYTVTDRNNQPYRIYQYNQYKQCTLLINYFRKASNEEPIASVQKLIYGPDGMLKTRISYYDGKLNIVNKYFYYK